MTQLRINELLGKANNLLERGFPLMPGFTLIKRDKMETILDRLEASIPEDVKEAELILRRRDEIQLEAQNRADRLVLEAQNEAARLLSESELLRAVQVEATRIKEQVIDDCEEVKTKAFEEADNIKAQVIAESAKIREGAETYAEQVLNNLEQDLEHLHQIVKNGQAYLEQLKLESYKSSTSSKASSSGLTGIPEYDPEYMID